MHHVYVFDLIALAFAYELGFVFFFFSPSKHAKIKIVSEPNYIINNLIYIYAGLVKKIKKIYAGVTEVYNITIR